MSNESVLWNDVKAGATVILIEGDEEYKVMDNKKGVGRNVQAPNGDRGDMYIHKFSHVKAINPRTGQPWWVRLRMTAQQAERCTRITIALGDSAAYRERIKAMTLKPGETLEPIQIVIA